MSAKEDLQRKIQRLESQLEVAESSLYAILCAEYEFQPGDVVKRHGSIFTVSRIGIRYGSPQAYGRKHLKGGNLGAVERELYGQIVRVVP